MSLVSLIILSITKIMYQANIVISTNQKYNNNTIGQIVAKSAVVGLRLQSVTARPNNFLWIKRTLYVYSFIASVGVDRARLTSEINTNLSRNRINGRVQAVAYI